jgi:thiamine-phosphate pyrophosphorylase
MYQTTKPRFVLFTPEIADAAAFAPALKSACDAADIAAVVLRLAAGTDAEQLARIQLLETSAHDIDAALLLNGIPQLIASAGADGAFVNGESVIVARKTVKNDHVVGAGKLESRHDAMTAAENGADFVLFGDSGPDGKRPTMPSLIERVTWWAELFVIPCVAYAAHLEEIEPLLHTGADFIAIGEEIVWNAADPAAALADANTRLGIAEHA